jgi:ubiquinone/menaquinone biosynthesis C-methylase UbiE
MEVKSPSPYLPVTKRQNFFLILKTSFAYRIWRKDLKKYGGFNKNSRFKILEVGCGPGYFLRWIEKWFPESEPYGLDLDEQLIEFAGTHLNKTKLIIHDGHTLPFPDNTFDVVCSLQVIEHLESPESFFQEAKRTLKTNGLLILSTPNPTGVPANMLGKKWHGYRDDHISLQNPGQWRNLLFKTGYKILDDGTTLLSGFKILQRLPFALINWIPMAIFGYFPWYKGESYMVIARRV